MPLFLQRTAAHFPFEPQCALIGRTWIAASQNYQTRVVLFNPITGEPTKDIANAKEGLVFDFDVRQAFLSNQADSQFLKPLFLLDSLNKLHVLPEKAVEDPEIKKVLAKPSVIFSTINDAENRTNALVGFALKLDNKVYLNFILKTV